MYTVCLSPCYCILLRKLTQPCDVLLSLNAVFVECSAVCAIWFCKLLPTGVVRLYAAKKQRSCVPQALLSHSLSSAIATFDLLCPFLSPNPHGSVHGMCTIHSIA